MYRCTGYYHSTRALCTVFWVTSHHHSTVYRDAGYHQSTRVLCTGVLCTGYCHNNRVLCTIILFTIRIGVSSTYVTFVYSYYHQRQCTYCSSNNSSVTGTGSNNSNIQYLAETVYQLLKITLVHVL